jgi:hypothetical protein
MQLADSNFDDSVRGAWGQVTAKVTVQHPFRGDVSYHFPASKTPLSGQRRQLATTEAALPANRRRGLSVGAVSRPLPQTRVALNRELEM